MFGPSGLEVYLSNRFRRPRLRASVVLLSNNRQRHGVVFILKDAITYL